MRLISLVEQLFFLLERQKQPMHVGGLFLFNLPNNADNNFVANLVRQMKSGTTDPTFPFNQVLHNLTFWKTTAAFDLEHHFHHKVLPSPYSKEAFYSYISEAHSKILDKDHPLWECHIIEGIPSDHNYASEQEDASKLGASHFALYFKIHHSLVDGIAAMRLVERSLSPSPNEIMHLPPWALLRRNKKALNSIKPPRKSFPKILKEQVSTIKPVYNELRNDLEIREQLGYVSTLQAPKTPLNQRITQSRKLTTCDFQLENIDKIAKWLRVSMNDVILAICSSALRQYLIQLNELPKDPLIAFVPVSLRKDNSATGNQTSLVLCNLATHLADPLQRIKTIQASMKIGKDKFGRLQQAQVINYSALTYAWEGVNLLTNIYPNKQAFNILISNVPGPKQKLYWDGAELSALYPASVLFDGQALNITITSYLDKLHFGILGCDSTLPHLDRFTSLLNQALDELQGLYSQRTTKRLQC